MPDTGSLISWATIVNIVIGAAIGAVVSYVFQRNSFAEARRQKERDKFETDQAKAYSLFFKMMQIASNVRTLHIAVEDGFAKNAAADRTQANPWRRVLPFGNLPDRITFTADEMTTLFNLKNDRLLNQMLSWDAVHNSLIDIAEAYSAKRVALTGQFAPKEMVGELGRIELGPDDTKRLAPLMIELNLILEQFRKRLDIERKDSARLLQSLYDTLSPKFEFKFKIQYKD